MKASEPYLYRVIMSWTSAKAARSMTLEMSLTRLTRSFFFILAIVLLFVILDLAAGPFDEILHVGSVGVAAVMLTPGQFAVQQAR